MSNDENRKKLSQLAERAWADEKLRNELLGDPMPLLQQNGIEIPKGFDVEVLASKDSISFNYTPQRPANGAELPESTLDGVVGGYLVFTFKLVAVKTIS
jgi:hypothetical protein